MEQSKKHIGIYLIIAFSIAWVSVASILNFHMHKIYGEDLLGQLEYIKSDQKTSIKEDSGLSYKIGFNNGDLAMDTGESESVSFFQVPIVSTQLIKCKSQDCYLTPVLRGPPSNS